MTNEESKRLQLPRTVKALRVRGETIHTGCLREHEEGLTMMLLREADGVCPRCKEAL